jgi:hypothetical protein
MAPRAALFLMAIGTVVAAVTAAPRAEKPLTYKTFLSQPINLRSGQVANTNSMTTPLEFLTEPSAIRFFGSTVGLKRGKGKKKKGCRKHAWACVCFASGNNRKHTNAALWRENQTYPLHHAGFHSS